MVVSLLAEEAVVSLFLFHFLIFSPYSRLAVNIGTGYPGLFPPVSWLLVVVYKIKTWKQEFLVMVNIYLFLQHSDTGVMATWPIT